MIGLGQSLEKIRKVQWSAKKALARDPLSSAGEGKSWIQSSRFWPHLALETSNAEPDNWQRGVKGEGNKLFKSKSDLAFVVHESVQNMFLFPADVSIKRASLSEDQTVQTIH